MARKESLRKLREGTVINLTSAKQETELGKALKTVEKRLKKEFGLPLHHARELRLSTAIEGLRNEFADVPFAEPEEKSAMRPDGGILSVEDKDGNRHTILIAEVKNQGTNDFAGRKASLDRRRATQSSASGRT